MCRAYFTFKFLTGMQKIFRVKIFTGIQNFLMGGKNFWWPQNGAQLWSDAKNTTISPSLLAAKHTLEFLHHRVAFHSHITDVDSLSYCTWVNGGGTMNRFVKNIQVKNKLFFKSMQMV